MKTIYIDPSYEVYYNDKLFDLTDPILNRDDILLPFSRIRNSKLAHNVNVNTADFLITELDKGQIPDHSSYYSLGILKNIKKINLVKKIKREYIIVPSLIV